MGFSTNTAYADNTTLANFKSWSTPVHNALIAGGWTLASGTDVTGVSSAPAVNSNVQENWQMTDTLASTNQTTLAIQYGSGTSLTIPTVLIALNNGSSGTLYTISPNVAGGATLYDCYFSYASNRFQMCLWAELRPTILSFERSKNASGADTATYVSYIVAGVLTNSPFVYHQILYPGAVIATEKYGCVIQSSNTSASVLGNVAVSPFFPLVGVMDNPVLGMVCLKSADFTNLSTFTTSLYGSTHTYLVIKDPSSGYLIGNNAANCFGMRYE